MATMMEQPRTRHSAKSRRIPAKGVAPLLVATDASAAADAAIRATQVIALHTGQSVRLIAVHEPLPLASPEAQIASMPSMNAEGRASLRQLVREQFERIGVDAEWHLDIVTGDPAATIVGAAQSIGASLVIMGLGEHGLFDRLLGDETVLRVLRLGTVPVLGVAQGFRAIPVNVLAALDFTSSSVRGARLAANLMSPYGKLTLAHVMSPELDDSNWKGSNSGYQGTIGRAFDLVVADLGFKQAEIIERKVLAGDPTKAVLALAEQIEPDLIVAGSHGRGFLTRLLLGSVSQNLVRNAKCSVLITPPEAGPSFLEELPQVTTRFAAYEWAERLEEFTRRNAGRVATLEVIDPDIGAQIEQKGFPFVGASFDPRDGKVHIMLGALGELNGRNRHLTRSISGATAIQVLRDREGRDILLRVAHGRGQTLLTLER